MLYLKLDQNGDPVGLPMIQSNIEDICGTRLLTPAVLAEHGYAEIKNCYSANVAECEYATKAEIVKNSDGTIEQLWDIRVLTPEEKIRTWVDGPRFFKLINTDWTQLADSPLSAEEKTAWAEYRQALRDLTDIIDFPNLKSHAGVPWPNPPAVMRKWDASQNIPSPIPSPFMGGGSPRF
jgi:hypothetical protein